MAERKVGSDRFAANPGNRGKGRPKGTPNKTTALLKDAILKAATDVGENGDGKDGLVGYLRIQAQAQPAAFMSLLGKVLPMQVTGEGGGAITVQVLRFTGEE